MESLEVSKEERLLATYKSQIDNISRFKDAFQTGKMTEDMFSRTSWSFFQTFAIKSFFIDGDIDIAKLCFFKCGLLDELMINKYNAGNNYGVVHMTSALLSDNSSLILRYSDLKHGSNPETLKAGISTPVYILQCIIKEDWAAFQYALELMIEKTVPKYNMELDAEYFRAFADGDKDKMEQILTELLSPKEHKRRNSQQVYGEFISQPALGYAKLAWLKGIEVKVNSPLVPKELLLVNPLKHYRELDLFSDFK